MPNMLNGFLDNFLGGVLNPGGNLRDAQHAQRLYVDDAFRLAPKVKFLYYVVFNMSQEALSMPEMARLSSRHRAEINMLVKSVDLPGYNIQTETKNQYNRKKNLQTRIDYSDVSIRLHDDNVGVTTGLMEAYYKYYYNDGQWTDAGSYDPRNTYKGEASHGYRYGLDTKRSNPFFNNIQIYQLSRQEFTCFTLVNPIIQRFQHDSMDQSDGAGTVENTLSVVYESVRYSRGLVEEDNPATFGTSHYDVTPSPLSIEGGGTRSLFGTGGILDGAGSVIGDFATGQVGLDTLIAGANTFRNAGQLTKEGLIQEGFSVLGNALKNVGSTEPGGVANTTFPTGNGTGGTASTTVATPSTLSGNVSAADRVVQGLRANGLL